MPVVDRRGFIKAAGVVLAAGAVAGTAGTARAVTYNANVDEKLFEGINRQINPSSISSTELHHVPALKVIGKVKAGEPFSVEVRVGRELHGMSAAHWISELTLMAGNEPVATLQFSPNFVRPVATFMVSVDKPVTLVAQARCNLHGLWEGTLDVTPEKE